MRISANPYARYGENVVQQLSANPLLLLALVLATVTVALVTWSARRDTVAPLLSITWIVHLLLWSALPLLLQQTSIEIPVSSDGPWSRAGLSVLQSASLLLLILLYLGFRRPYLSDVRTFFDGCAPDVSRLFWPTAVAVALLVAVEIQMTRLSGASFAEAVAFSVSASSGDLAKSGILEVLVTFLLGYSVALISLGRPGGATSGTLILAWVAVLTFGAFSIARGSRAVVLLPLVVGVVALSTLQGSARRRATAIITVLGILTIAIGAPVAAMMGVARGGRGTLSLELIQDAYSVVIGATSVRQRVETVGREVNVKFDAIGPGVELLAMEAPGTAGLTPILSAMVSPIPRAIYPTKPVPTSRDGTYLGTPFRIAAKVYGDPENGMVVPVSASAIALWEFGGLGPLVLVLANLLGLVLLNTVLITRNIFARALGISMLNLPNAEFFIAPPSAVVQNSLRMMLFVVVLALLALVAKQFGRVSAGRMARVTA